MAEDQLANTNTDKNQDPISGEPGSHPVGTGIGAALGGAGAAAGIVAGPAGAVVGAMAGAIAGGGYGGKAAAEAINPTAEEAYWRENSHKAPYYEAGRPFDDYAPAYRLGVTGRVGYSGSFEEYEDQLGDG